jgi:hypothetical protein
VDVVRFGSVLPPAVRVEIPPDIFRVQGESGGGGRPRRPPPRAASGAAGRSLAPNRSSQIWTPRGRTAVARVV